MQAASTALLTSYRDFATTLIEDGVVSDPWVEGAPRFRMTPVVLTGAQRAELYRAGEAMVAVHDEAIRLCATCPALVRKFFDWPDTHWQMWLASRGDWHGIARADVFVTEDGPVVCELNSDTPSGQPEAIALGRLFTCDRIGGRLLDPNQHLTESIRLLMEAAAARVVSELCIGGDEKRPSKSTIGILYPTELTDELCVVEQLERCFRSSGFAVVLGSPFNLKPDGFGGVALFGIPCAVIYRHYKTDWWGERRAVWREATIRDAEPIAGPLSLLLSASAKGRCAVVNPWGAVLSQNKRLMALMWEELSHFSLAGQKAIRRYIPFTSRMEAIPQADLKRGREGWVLKTDYGAEGEEVLLGSETTQSEWDEAVERAEPRRWIAQRRFVALHDTDSSIANYGVFVVDHQACGLFTRLQMGSTDRHALSAATLVRVP